MHYALVFFVIALVAALFGFGVSVAVERGQGWMRIKRVAPMPPLAYFVAKVLMSLAIATVIVLAMFALGALLGGVRLGLDQWVAVGLALIAGALPFSAMVRKTRALLPWTWGWKSFARYLGLRTSACPVTRTLRSASAASR